MPQREFDITIGKDGSVELQIKGYKGRACLEAARTFEKIVGETQSESHTSEFYEPEEQVRRHLDQSHGT